MFAKKVPRDKLFAQFVASSVVDGQIDLYIFCCTFHYFQYFEDILCEILPHVMIVDEK